jgi:cytochrome c oxidase subunit 5a
LKASRKVNDYATAVRILEGVKEKVENVGQYKAYIEELSPVIKDLGTFYCSQVDRPFPCITCAIY